MFNLLVRTDRTLVKSSPDVIERQGGIAADWDLMLSSDECRFNPSHADGRKSVYRCRGERFADACVIERDRFRGESVLVWGGIMGGNNTRLMVLIVTIMLRLT